MTTTETISRVPVIGQHWPEQGGIYIGQRLIDGQPHHIIIAPGIESDIQDVKFADVDKAIAEVGEINGHADWRAPEQEDLMLAYVNAPDQFVRKGLASIYWSRSEHHDWPWAVGFEGGNVLSIARCSEFRVRPFRSIVASSI
ncbi:hypothetical protein [Alcaligenes sp. SDU_A2]|uniref:hypothetical protein n=1 Tax=Alcaligenes sp. SDU_A2 TaxID=3136634 RepID=UPI00311F1296